MNEDGKYTVVWKSNKVDNSLSPVFPAAKITMSSLCNGDVHRPLKIEIFDWDSNGKHQSMGVVSPSCIACLTVGSGCMSMQILSLVLQLLSPLCLHCTSFLRHCNQVETSVNAMLTSGEAPMDVIEAEKVKTKKTYTNSGHLIAGAAHIEHRPTFTDVSILFYGMQSIRSFDCTEHRPISAFPISDFNF